MAPRHTPPPSTPSGAADRARRPSLNFFPRTDAGNGRSARFENGAREPTLLVRLAFDALRQKGVCFSVRRPVLLAETPIRSPRVSPPYPKEGGVCSAVISS